MPPGRGGALRHHVAETMDSSLATVIVDMSSTSAAGGYSDGVLGCYNPSGEITLIQGWN
jgi:hypothetical protein